MNQKRFSFGAVVIEIIIVIVGITIAFWLNNWGEERKERQLEIEFLKTLRTEIASDSAAFVFQIESNTERVKNLNRFTEILRNEDFANDSIRWFARRFLNRNNWIISTNTYEILKSGGQLDIISDFDLRTDINFFYRIRTFQTEGTLEAIQSFVDNQLQPYLTAKTDYFISQRPDLSFVRDREFQNLVALWTSYHEYKLSLYEEVLGDIEELMTDIDKHLKN